MDTLNELVLRGAKAFLTNAETHVLNGPGCLTTCAGCEAAEIINKATRKLEKELKDDFETL